MDAGDLASVALFTALTVVFLVGAGANWSVLRGRARPPAHRSAGHGVASGGSMVPMLAGVAGAAACLVGPFPALRSFFWVPVVLDPGTVFYAAAAAAAAVREAVRARVGTAPVRATEPPPGHQATAALPGSSATASPPGPLAPAPAPADSPATAAHRAGGPIAPLERALTGCLLGTAVGDAIGLPAEGLTRSRQRRLFPELDGHRLLPGRGMVSDDTEHACMVAQAVIAAHGYPAPFRASLGWRLRLWLLALPAGVGFATLRAILKLWLGIPPCWSGVRSAGNGPAMRSPILGVCFGSDPARLLELVTASTRITHTHEDAEAGALAIAVAAHCAATGTTTPAGYLARLEAAFDGRHPDWIERVEAIGASVASGQSTEAFADGMGLERGVSGYVLHTVPVALHAWLRHPGDFRSGTLAVVRLGGDTDTTAAITGALIGAGAGRAAIPAEWLDGIIEWPRTVAWMERLAGALARTAADVTEHRPPRPGQSTPPRLNPVAILLRNLVFLVVVLAHGLRRAFPPY